MFIRVFTCMWSEHTRLCPDDYILYICVYVGRWQSLVFTTSVLAVCVCGFLHFTAASSTQPHCSSFFSLMSLCSFYHLTGRILLFQLINGQSEDVLATVWSRSPKAFISMQLVMCTTMGLGVGLCSCTFLRGPMWAIGLLEGPPAMASTKPNCLLKILFLCN